jgi:hypothetical protein
MTGCSSKPKGIIIIIIIIIIITTTTIISISIIKLQQIQFMKTILSLWWNLICFPWLITL